MNIELAYECFKGCKKLNSTIPENLFKDMKKLTQIHDMFSESSISGEIPKDLFINNSEVEKIQYLFAGCSGITGKIPGNLFDTFSKVTSFRGVFRGCNITSIDEKLFSKNNLATDFVNVFRECKNIKNIPQGLFENNIEAIEFNDCFRECTELQEIPTDLFEKNNKVNNYTETFFGCNKLRGNAVKLWEKEINPKGIDCYFGCTTLNNYNDIPEEWK